MNPSIKRIPPHAIELFALIQHAYEKMGESPVLSQRKLWFEFVVTMHGKSTARLSGQEFYAFLTDEHGWRNDLAQNLVVEYNLAMELLDFLDERPS